MPQTSARIGRALLVLSGLLGFVLATSGCTSWQHVQERLEARNAPHTTTVAGEQRQVFEAARAAMIQQGFSFERGGAAVGNLEGISALNTTPAGRRAVQQTMTIQLVKSLEVGQIEVQVWIAEVLETDPYRTTGQAGSTPVREDAQYERYFRLLRAQLAAAE